MDSTNGLIPVIVGRPAVVKVNGGIIFLSLHDEYYKRELKRLKQLIYDCHPDRRWWTRKTVDSIGKSGRKQGGGSHRFGTAADAYPLRDKNTTRPFMQAKEVLDEWVRAQIKWYGELGLEPPK